MSIVHSPMLSISKLTYFEWNTMENKWNTIKWNTKTAVFS